MPPSHSLARLLLLLLQLPEDTPVFATPGFRNWFVAGRAPEWPPAGGEPGVWLVDTRDTEARRTRHIWESPDDAGDCRALLALARSRRTGGVFRRTLRRLRGRGRPRLPPADMRSSLARAYPQRVVTTLAYDVEVQAPTDFRLGRGRASEGAALLLTRSEPFSGPLWKRIGRKLDGADLEVLGFQLRIRGAAVVLVRSRGRDLVLRIVPEGGHQELVARHHAALREVREALTAVDDLLGVIPEPVFSGRIDGALVLAETLLPGTLAWKVAGGSPGPVIQRESVRFLERLRKSTRRPVPLTNAEVLERITATRRRFEEASFLGPAFHQAVRAELQRSAGLLEGKELFPHVSHGDFGYGNILVDPDSGGLEGVIDWDTARMVDFPSVDRVNLAIQIQRAVAGESFPEAVESAWRSAAAAQQPGASSERTRGLFGLAVCRYVERALNYPTVFEEERDGFARALSWLARTGTSRSASS